MTGNVIITDSGTPTIDLERQVLEPAGFRVSRIEPGCKTEDDVIKNCQDADVLLVQWAPITRRVLEALPDVRCIVRYGIGVNNFDLDAARDLGVVAANIPDYCLEEVSNHAMAMILAICRRIPESHHQLANGRWSPIELLPIPAPMDMTLGLIGFGNIARTVARKALCFGFNIIASDPYVANETFSEFGVTRVELDELFRQSDMISIHCPLSAETTHLVDQKAFAAMKDGVMIVNTSRGSVIDEVALIAALDSGKVAAAGLDVYEVEPLPADSPLRGRSNVFMSSHMAATSNRADILLQVRPAEAARDFLQGKRPKSALVWHEPTSQIRRGAGVAK